MTPKPLEEEVAELERIAGKPIRWGFDEYEILLRLIADWRKRGEVVNAARHAWSTLADWMDLKCPNDPNPEVQRDLRNLEDAVASYLVKKEPND